MITKSHIQFPKEHYYNNYDSLTRFISYFYQIDLIKKLESKTILEIGIGNKTVSNYLKQHNFNVTTCDLDKNLKPNYVADIRNLPFKNNSFDTILACEVLEHLPWSNVNKALDELHRVTRGFVIISIPFPINSLEIIFKSNWINRISKKSFISLFFRIPWFTTKLFSGHYWEVRNKEYTIKKFRKVLFKKFKIIKEIRPMLDSYHYFFVLKNRIEYQQHYQKIDK